MSNQTISAGAATALSTNTFTPPNAVAIFDGWNTAADGSGTSYTDGESVTNLTTVGQTITLYAQWKTYLYNAVSVQSKGKQTNDTNTTTGIKTNPTAPTSSATVSPNSGVYEYDSSVFGADTDGTKSDSTKATIYYYRGILDSYGNTNTNGSAGLSDAYPNYVILSANGTKSTSDTCWRIIRTTGSGGVKMIYNGLWTGSTCANGTTSTRISSPVTTSTFNGTASTQAQARQAVRVGYTHNSTYATTSGSNVAVDTLFGSDSNYSVNDANSTVKDNIETWFGDTLSDYEGMLESNANYCNDRSAFTTTAGTTATSTLYSYTTSTSTGTSYRTYFGSYVRNMTTNKAPSLGCSRSTVDRYSTSTSAGGNGQLSSPVALITADEASFAGSGSSTASQGSGYSANSFLRTGDTFWTMSPYYRSGSYAYNFYMNANGYMTYGRVDTQYDIRPVISFKEGTTIASGSGIATDPWVVKVDTGGISYMQNLTPVTCQKNVGADGIGDEFTAYDKRDNKDYTVRYINGSCWMTQNLRFTDTSVSVAKSNVTTDKTLTYYSLDSSDSSYSGHCDSTNAYDNACIKDSGSTSTGVWYNYYAATAGTIAGSSNNTNATQDICPKNWHLPSAPNTTSGTDFNELIGNTNSGWQSATAGLTAFGAVAGGAYSMTTGSLINTGYGYWWSATARTTTSRNNMRYLSSSNTFNGNDYYGRDTFGFYVRCVLSDT